MMYEIQHSTKYKRQYKNILKRGYDVKLLQDVVCTLATGKPLPAKYRDHPLHGEYRGYRECHITPDWLLVYKIKADVLILVLHRTGTHSDLF